MNRFWHGFDTISILCWMLWNSNPLPFDHESSSLPTRPNFRLLIHFVKKPLTRLEFGFVRLENSFQKVRWKLSNCYYYRFFPLQIISNRIIALFQIIFILMKRLISLFNWIRKESNSHYSGSPFDHLKCLLFLNLCLEKWKK